MFSRGGTLLPSIYADARYVDAAIVSKVYELNRATRPSPAIKLAAQVACILWGIHPEKVAASDGTFKKVKDWWGPARKIFDSTFVSGLRTIFETGLSSAVMREIRAVAQHRDWTDQELRNDHVPKAASAIYGVVSAMELTDRLTYDIAKLKESLAVLDKTLRFNTEAVEADEALHIETSTKIHDLRLALKDTLTEQSSIKDSMEELRNKKGIVEEKAGGVDLRTMHLFRETVIVEKEIGSGRASPQWRSGRDGSFWQVSRDTTGQTLNVLGDEGSPEDDDSEYTVVVQGSIISVSNPDKEGQQYVDIEATMAPCFATAMSDHFGTERHFVKPQTGGNSNGGGGGGGSDDRSNGDNAASQTLMLPKPKFKTIGKAAAALGRGRPSPTSPTSPTSPQPLSGGDHVTFGTLLQMKRVAHAAKAELHDREEERQDANNRLNQEVANGKSTEEIFRSAPPGSTLAALCQDKAHGEALGYDTDCRKNPYGELRAAVVGIEKLLTDPVQLAKRLERTGPWALGGALHGKLGTSVVLRVPASAVSPAVVPGLKSFCCKIGTKLIIRQPGRFDGYCCTIAGVKDRDIASETHVAASDDLVLACDNADSAPDPYEFKYALSCSFKLMAWNFELAPQFSHYIPGDKLIVHVSGSGTWGVGPAGAWLEVIVEEHIQFSRYCVIHAARTTDLLEIDLNGANHYEPKLDVITYAAEVDKYVAETHEASRKLIDGITGLEIDQEHVAVHANVFVIHDPEGEAAEAHRTAARFHGSTHYGNAVGSSFTSCTNVGEICKQLNADASDRQHGWHEAEPVIITGDVGTGKTWLMQQAIYLLCCPHRTPSLPSIMRPGRMATGTDTPVVGAKQEISLMYIPLFISVSKLAAVHAEYVADGKSPDVANNLVGWYLEHAFQGNQLMMLQDAHNSKRLILLLDGLDEALEVRAGSFTHARRNAASWMCGRGYWIGCTSHAIHSA